MGKGSDINRISREGVRIKCLEVVWMSMGERTLWYFKTSQKLATVALPYFNSSSHGRQRQAALSVGGQPGLKIEFQASQEYKVRPSSQTNKRNQTTKVKKKSCYKCEKYTNLRKSSKCQGKAQHSSLWDTRGRLDREDEGGQAGQQSKCNPSIKPLTPGVCVSGALPSQSSD